MELEKIPRAQENTPEEIARQREEMREFLDRLVAAFPADTADTGKPLEPTQEEREEQFHAQALEIQAALQLGDRNFELEVDGNGYAHLVYKGDYSAMAISMAEEEAIQPQYRYNVMAETYVPKREGSGFTRQDIYYYSAETVEDLLNQMSFILPRDDGATAQ